MTSLLLLTTLSAAQALAEGARIVFANDILASNRLTDELYTGALELDFDQGPYRVSLGENLFTDSENDLRFDETYLGIERGLPAWGHWLPAVEVGVVHVGRGLLGQGAQNALHRLIGEDLVDLPYVESNRYHPTLRLRFHRPVPLWYRLSTSAYGEVYSAFGFKSHATAGLEVDWPVFSFASFTAGLGARYTATRFDALEPHIARLAATWQAGLRLRDGITFSWSHNDFGTRTTHFTIGYDVSLKRGSRTGRSRAG